MEESIQKKSFFYPPTAYSFSLTTASPTPLLLLFMATTEVHSSLAGWYLSTEFSSHASSRPEKYSLENQHEKLLSGFNASVNSEFVYIIYLSAEKEDLILVTYLCREILFRTLPLISTKDVRSPEFWAWKWQIWWENFKKKIKFNRSNGVKSNNFRNRTSNSQNSSFKESRSEVLSPRGHWFHQFPLTTSGIVSERNEEGRKKTSYHTVQPNWVDFHHSIRPLHRCSHCRRRQTLPIDETSSERFCTTHSGLRRIWKTIL